jgi:5,10-methylenetetrahydromethanopterin reductase
LNGIGLVTLGDAPSTRVVAEANGLTTLWITDEAFFRGAVPIAVACAGVTSRIRIGLGVVNPYDHPPVWMSKDFATLQELAGGRAVLGVGAAWKPPIEAQGIPWTRPLAAVRDTVAIVRTLLAGEECSYRGEKFTVHGVRLDFEPPQSRSSILIGAMLPRSFRQAGAIADGVILSILCPPAYVKAARALVEEGADRAGHDTTDFEIVQYVPMEVSADGEEARRSARRYVASLLEHTYGSGDDRWDKVAQMGELDADDFARVYDLLRGGASPADAISDSLLDRLAIAGTPERCLELVQAYKAAGTTELVAMVPPWSDLELQVETIGERLVPEWEHL